MLKRFLFVCSAVLLTGTTIVVAQNAGIQSIIGNVFLQNTTPGTVQAGHATIGGTFRAGQVFVQQASGATIPIVGNNTSWRIIMEQPMLSVSQTEPGIFDVKSASDNKSLEGTAYSDW